jgi:hypothetical protein
VLTFTLGRAAHCARLEGLFPQASKNDKEKNMKKGLIVYLVDSDNLPEAFDGDSALTHLSLSFDQSVLAASTEGFYDIPEAWHLMLTRGMQYISCVKGRFDEAGKIELYGESLRLYG